MKTIQNSRHILQKAIDTYGMSCQLAKLQEEIGEYVTAYGRCIGACSKEDVSEEELGPLVSNMQEEIADCIIMFEQMRMMYGEEEINEWIDYKLDRLERRLNEKEEPLTP